MLTRGPFRVACMLLLCVSLGVQGFAQVNTASLTGLVSDPTGAAVTGANVTAKNRATNVETSATTDASGYYTFASLPVGGYTLTVEVQGFKKTVQENVALGLPFRRRMTVRRIEARPFIAEGIARPRLVGVEMMLDETRDAVLDRITVAIRASQPAGSHGVRRGLVFELDWRLALRTDEPRNQFQVHREASCARSGSTSAPATRSLPGAVRCRGGTGEAPRI